MVLTLLCLSAWTASEGKKRRKIRPTRLIRDWKTIKTCRRSKCTNREKAIDETIMFQIKVAKFLNSRLAEARKLQGTKKDHEKRIKKLETSSKRGLEKNNEALNLHDETMKTLREDIDKLTPELDDMKARLYFWTLF